MARASEVLPRPHVNLRREIIAILAFKLLALIALYLLFFDERPHITPTASNNGCSSSRAPPQAGP